MSTYEQLQSMLTDRPDRQVLPRMRCAGNGGSGPRLSFSMQASEYHYCSPRNNTGPYSRVEIGFPSRRVTKWLPYADSFSSKPTRTVYAFVPLDLVAEVVDLFGGLEP